MLSPVLDKLTGFFDKRFVIAYWSPLFTGSVIMLGLILILSGRDVAESWWNSWNKLPVTDQVLIGGGVLLLITLFAFVLEMLSEPISRLYQGYWPRVFSPLSRRLIARQAKILRSNFSLIYGQKLLHLENVRPTKLGNILTAADQHAFQLYRLDAAVWWPRLTPLLPEAFRKQMDTTLAPMQAMLNLSLIFTLIVGVGGTAALEHRNWLFFAIIFIVGLFIARMCYINAAVQAGNYSLMVMVAYDFYRKDILKQMSISEPDSLLGERILWDALNHYIFSAIMPWEISDKIPQLQEPFYYFTHKQEHDKE